MPRIPSTRTINDEEVLVDGVPVWMRNSVLALIREVTTAHRGRDPRGQRILGVRDALIHTIERKLHATFTEDEGDEWELQASLLSYCNDGEHALDVIGALLDVGGSEMQQGFPRLFQQVNEILIESGSKWHAVEQGSYKATLEERVEQAAADAMTLSIEDVSNNSSALLKSAWSDAFGRDPSASDAYTNAVKAMEAAAGPVLTPNNTSATLGHMIGELRANPTRWKSQLIEATPGNGSATVMKAMELVWEGHADRHGTNSPEPVTQEAAEQAVFTAVMVCSYFNRNYMVTT